MRDERAGVWVLLCSFVSHAHAAMEWLPALSLALHGCFCHALAAAAMPTAAVMAHRLQPKILSTVLQTSTLFTLHVLELYLTAGHGCGLGAC